MAIPARWLGAPNSAQANSTGTPAPSAVPAASRTPLITGFLTRITEQASTTNAPAMHRAATSKPGTLRANQTRSSAKKLQAKNPTQIQLSQPIQKSPPNPDRKSVV